MALKSMEQVYQEKDTGAPARPMPAEVTLTPGQLEDIIEGTVQRTLVHMGLKGSSLMSGRIYRQEMLDVISVRKFEAARVSGRLKCHKDGSRNSKVWARREDWEQYLKLHTNKKL